MEKAFWRKKWENNEIAFHEGAPNSLLIKHFHALDCKEGTRICVPLCGKSRDIHWLLSQGMRIVGVELSEIAVQQLFAEMDLDFHLSAQGDMKRYSAPGLDIYAGDIFAISKDMLGAVDAVYDRAALVALPAPMRKRYASHLAEISGACPQLLICYEYDQDLANGPPFSIDDVMVERLYGDRYALTQMERVMAPGGMKGQCEAWENVWLLKARAPAD